MLTLENIRNPLTSGRFEFSRHAFRRAVERNISDTEIVEMAQNAELIEDYSDDKYSASCLLLGYTSTGRPLHIQVSRAETDLVKIVTLYEPDPSEWDQGYRVRR